MCSWCYGFGPELSRLFDTLPDLTLEIVVGGLRAYNTEEMDPRLRATLVSHWHHVEEASGLPFSDGAIARPGFVYDTEPACRAVVAARLLAPDLSPPAQLGIFHAIQRAFYAEGIDVTRGETLADIASAALIRHDVPIDAATFHARWAEQETIAATRADFSRTQQWGISGFPAVLIESHNKLLLMVSGYTKSAVLRERVQALTGENA